MQLNLLGDLPRADFFHDFEQAPSSTTFLSRILEALSCTTDAVSARYVIRNCWSVSLCRSGHSIKETGISMYASRLSTLSALPSSGSNLTVKSPWKLLEARVIWQYGYQALDAVDDMDRDHRLSPSERSFVLHAMVTHGDKKLIAQELRSWAAVATSCIIDFGLAETTLLFNAVQARVARLPSVMTALTMTALIKAFGSAIDAKSIKKIKEVVENRRNDSFSSWLKYFAQVINQELNLGQDRTIDDLLMCMIARPTNEFKSHLFSFDGTPVVSLPPAEIDILRDILTTMEGLASVYQVMDPIGIRESCSRLGTQLDCVKKANLPAASINPIIAELIAAIREGVLKVLTKKPFLVQCACVVAFLIGSPGSATYFQTGNHTV